MSSREPLRFDLAGGCNLRDLGGYPTLDGRRVRYGVVYRSGVLAYLTPADHAALAPAGISTIIDLRREDEIATEPTEWAGPVRIRSWPLAEAVAAAQRSAPWENSASADEAREWLIGSYATMQDWLVAPLRGLFDALLEGEVPVLFHCAAGKDRTGFCAAMVLGLAGVGADDILADYALTNTAVDLYAFTLTHRAAGMGLTDVAHPFAKMDPAVRDALMRADPAYLKSALDSVVAAHGTIEGYARQALGLSDAQIATIRERLLED